VPRRSTVQQRQRQERRGARQRILDVTRALLDERAWSDIPLEDVTAGAGLTRTAFYRHFDDRDQVLLALLDELGLELAVPAQPWQRAPGAADDSLRRALEDLTALFVAHGPVLAAIADAAGRDAEVAARYDALADGLIAAAEQRIRSDVADGRTVLDDPHAVATALVWMNERYLMQMFGRRPHRATPQEAASALHEVWWRTLYGGAATG
jgi:AcrR family transcriptional regulator